MCAFGNFNLFLQLLSTLSINHKTHVVNKILFNAYLLDIINFINVCLAGRSRVMAANGEASMISPQSSISNGQEPTEQIPPLPPPLRSTQILQPLSVFPGAILHFH